MKEKTFNKKEPVSKALIIAWAFIAICAASFVFYTLYEIYLHNSTLPFIYSLVLLAGLIFEFKTICERWDKVMLTACLSFSFSFIAFFPIKEIGVENCLRIWPFMICAAFGVITVFSYREKSSIKLTEGITFMQCLAIIYWLINELTTANHHNALYVLLGVVLICFAFTAFHAFSYAKLTDRTRFLLSFWSAIIMTFFASLNIYTVYKMQQIATGTDVILTLFQHLFLGISSVYIIQNIYLIVSYIPTENWNEMKRYKKNRKNITAFHISRFSDKQVRRTHAAICFIACGLLFGINYLLDFVPANLTIWIAFLLVPLLLDAVENRYAKQQEIAQPKN